MSFTYAQLKQAIQDFTDNSETSFVTNLPIFIRGVEDRIFSLVDLELFRKNATSALTVDDPYLTLPTDYLASFSFQITTALNKEFLLQKDVNFVQEYNSTIATTGVPKYYALYDVNNFILAPTPNASFTAELHYYFRPTSLTASQFVLTVSSVSGTFQASETITGGTSGASTTISAITSATVFTVVIPSTDFTVGETVTGATSGATGTVVSTSADTTETWLSENAPNAMLYGSLVEAYTFMKGEPDVMKMYGDRFNESLIRLKDYGEARENADAYRMGLVRRTRT